MFRGLCGSGESAAFADFLPPVGLKSSIGARVEDGRENSALGGAAAVLERDRPAGAALNIALLRTFGDFAAPVAAEDRGDDTPSEVLKAFGWAVDEREYAEEDTAKDCEGALVGWLKKSLSSADDPGDMEDSEAVLAGFLAKNGCAVALVFAMSDISCLVFSCSRLIGSAPFLLFS